MESSGNKLEIDQQQQKAKPKQKRKKSNTLKRRKVNQLKPADFKLKRNSLAKFLGRPQPQQQQQQQQQEQTNHQSTQQRFHQRIHQRRNTSTSCILASPKCQMLSLLKYILPLLLLSNLSKHNTCDGMEYSAKLNNCYDIKFGFGSHYSNDTAPKELSNASAMATQQQKHLLSSKTTTTTTTSTTATSSILPEAIKINGTQVQLAGYPVTGWKCCCWNATSQDEIECRCEGEALTRVPQTLTVPMQRLTIASAGLPKLRSTGLKVYAGSLLDIVLTDLKQLETIEDGAFASTRLLRTIYISHAPKLTYLSKDVFFGISETIKIIRIINSGLKKIPDLVHLPPSNILQMIDLDTNHITRIDTKCLNIKTDQLILANNEINYIDDSAFYGSQIAKLTLKGNHPLQEVHSNAFSGISMQELDLSSTSLVRLPSIGLQDIEELRIQDTHTLKTIPSIYNMKNLQRAFLTHSFHCCAFKFPSRHDPRRHAERMKEIEKWQRQCTKNENDIANALEKLRKFGKYGGGGNGGGRGATGTDDEVKGTEVGAGFDWRNVFDFGVLYSRLKRTDTNGALGFLDHETFDDDNFDNETSAAGVGVGVDGVAENADYNDNFNSDAMIKDIGVFHEQITINPEENQLDEYCGNFTFRKRDVECYPMPNALNPCEDVMGYQWLRTSVWIVVALAVVGNVAVLVVILSIRSETTPVPRFLMCHLAFADLCLGLYLLLIASIDAHSMGEYFNYAYDWQYGAGCKVAGFLTVFASHLSVFTLTVITIERWLAITNALYLNKRIKLRLAAHIMFAGWIYSMIMSLFPLFGISNYSSTSICLPMEIRDNYDVFYLVAILGSNGVAFFVIAICYAQIYLSLGKETRHAYSAHPGDMTIAKKMALLVFTNFACWAPIAFFGLTALSGFPLINVTKSKILLVFFYPLNSCADPYLYAILTQQYRQDLYTLLAKLGICKQTVLRYKNSVSFPGTSNYTIQGGSTRRHSSLNNKHQQLQHQEHEFHQVNSSPEAQLMLIRKQEEFV